MLPQFRMHAQHSASRSIKEYSGTKNIENFKTTTEILPLLLLLLLLLLATTTILSTILLLPLLLLPLL